MNDVHDFIDRLSSTVPYGTIQLTIKRHDSHTTAIDGQKLTSHKTESNQDALAIVIALLKTAQLANDTGNLTFTISLQDGQATRMVVQDVRRVTLN